MRKYELPIADINGCEIVFTEESLEFITIRRALKKEPINWSIS